jgi:capsular polysaccharide biosynthesis protein
MEIKDYLNIFQRNIVWFVIIVILCGFSAFLWTKRQPQSYLASTTITVNKTSPLKQENVNYYLYDNFYNIQSASLFSQIVVNWFTSPAFVTEIYQKAGVTVPGVSQSGLARIFRAVRQEPATVNLSVAADTNENAMKLINAATDSVQNETNKLSKNSDSLYDIAKFAPIVSDNKPNVLMNTGIGLMAGLIISIFLSLALEYFRKK